MLSAEEEVAPDSFDHLDLDDESHSIDFLLQESRIRLGLMVNTWDAGPSASLSGLVFSVSCSLSRSLSLILSLSLFGHLPFNLTLTQSHNHTHSSLVLVVMMKSKELKIKISHAHSLILSLSLSLALALALFLGASYYSVYFASHHPSALI